MCQGKRAMERASKARKSCFGDACLHILSSSGCLPLLSCLFLCPFHCLSLTLTLSLLSVYSLLCFPSVVVSDVWPSCLPLSLYPLVVKFFILCSFMCHVLFFGRNVTCVEAEEDVFPSWGPQELRKGTSCFQLRAFVISLWSAGGLSGWCVFL